MQKLKLLVAGELVVIVLLASLLAVQNTSFSTGDPPKPGPPKFFLGVEIGWYASVDQAKAVIDKAKDYSNLIVIATPTITANDATLNETCDYAYRAGMYIVVYFSMQMYPDSYPGTDGSLIVSGNNTQVDMTNVVFRPFVWAIGAQQRYGGHFLGVYFFDEPGGRMIDNQLNVTVNISSSGQVDYTQAANSYDQFVSQRMNVFSPVAHSVGFEVFTSDYGLYWFDYQAGFDVVLAQLGWNNSRPLQIGLTRGAANLMGRDWGTILTWTSDQQPYMENATAFYQDLTASYDAGAKYVIVYDSTQNFTGTTLTDDHYNALKTFWNYVQQNPKKQGSFKAEVAAVLPQDFGFGFRSPEDSVWGVKPDTLAMKTYDDVMNLVNEYGYNLDVVYNDPAFGTAISNSYANAITLTYG